MKLTSLAVPVLVAALAVAALGGLGRLAVRASAVSTETSIHLLRINLRIARLHDQLLQHAKDSLVAQLEALPPRAPAPVFPPAARKDGRGVVAPTAPAAPGSEPSPEPWPEGWSEPEEARP
jgi:hypothetical protein